jgi:hypothetical protein
MRIQIATLFFIMSIVPALSRAATVSYSGSVTYPQTGFEALGTFKPGFDPHSIVAVYPLRVTCSAFTRRW